MLFRLPLSNIKRSIRDYAIYFFTLVIGVSVFYVFNAIGGQAAMLQVDQSNNGIVELLRTVITSVSIFVAIVLALLIVYASNYLMKRRNREFAVYMVLGMSKGRISALILMETMIIGIGSLIVGLILGACLSQLMSAVVAGLFEADMTKYKLSISGEALILTVFFFVLMYLAVMLFNTFAVTRMKLIDLIQSGRKAEKVKLKNPVLCTVFFL
ncbi:MAG: FtsX-like permease family protein, partial [Lachnospiraceae bacterium]|nr:FtsX-like permease family protein [Lachnospiraceae bacterium]